MQSQVRRLLSPRSSILLGLALLLIFLAERLLGSGTGRVVLDGLGALLLLLAGVDKVLALLAQQAAARRYGQFYLSAYALVLASLGAYALHLHAFATAPEGRGPALWYAIFYLLLLLGLALIAALELSAVQMRPAGFVDVKRSLAAMITGATLVCALGALLAVNYAGEQRPWRRDYSFGAPTSPSPATLSLVQTSDPPVELFVFLPRGNRLLAEVLPYFESLQQAGAKLIVQDQAVDPDLAKDLKITGNGYVGLRRGERKGKWYLGADFDAARLRLKRMDREMRTQIAQLTVPERVVYWTIGHEERGDQQSNKKDRPQAKVLHDLLRSLNVKLRRLGMVEGLGAAVPDDAAMVMVFGPQSDFLPQEVQALRDYLRGGGSLWLMLDPQHPAGLKPLLDDIGVELGQQVCNDRVFVDASHSDADHAFIVSNNFAHHDAAKSLNKVGQRATVLMQNAAVLHSTAKPWGKQTTLLRALSGSFVDLNGNFRFDADHEKRGVEPLIIVAEAAAKGDKAPARVAVLGDSDALADSLMNNKPNLVLGYEMAAWLLGDDRLGGEVDSDEDVAIQHTREGDKLWFYGTTFAAPIGVLALGLVYISLRRRRGRSA